MWYFDNYMIFILQRKTLESSNVSVIATPTHTGAQAASTPGPLFSTPVSSHSHVDLSFSKPQLPLFSERIKSQLDNGNIIDDFDKFVEETAYFLLSKGDIQDKGAYQDFGRLIHSTYPCIGHPGKEPWVG